MAGTPTVDASRHGLLRRVWGWRVLPFLLPIWIYQKFISPVLPPSCRHHPTCSEYTVQAIRQRGVLPGIIIGAWRILRCNPWGTSGYDPVEEFRWPWQRKGRAPEPGHDAPCRHEASGESAHP